MKKLAIALLFLAVLIAASPLYIQRGIFRNFSDITDYQFFDNDTVAKGPSEPWNLSSKFQEKELPQTYLDSIIDNKSIAFLVIQNDSILYENYWRGYHAESISGSFSMAKSVVSLLMGIAIEEGKVQSENDFISKYIPEFDRAGTDTIKIKDILTMSGGFDWVESYMNIFGKTADIYYGDRLKKVVGNLNADYAPGTEFYYSSAETQMIAWILENVYQQPLAEIFSEKIWSKIGAEHDAFWSLDKKDGDTKAFCCLNSNARDFARLGKLVLQNGQWNGEQIVPEDYVKKATSAATWLKDRDGNTLDYYGYQFWIINYKGMTIPYFRGVKGQMIYVIPDKNAIVVRLGEYISQDKIHNHSINTYTYLDAALKILD